MKLFDSFKKAADKKKAAPLPPKPKAVLPSSAPSTAQKPVVKPAESKPDSDDGVTLRFEPEKTNYNLKEFEILSTNVDKFDLLLQDGGIERTMTVLITGGAGTGKTTFGMQSLYYSALKGERGVYISFEEDPQSIKHHMKKNYGWDFDALEKKGLVAIIKFDPVKIARQVEEILVKEAGMLRIKVQEMVLPIMPDRICIDSLSALSIEFENEKNYRKYVKELFRMLGKYNSLNFVIGETEQNPQVYSRSGVEEFLGDGVVVLYNLKIAGQRKNALEILKLRSGRHVKEMIPYALTEKGIQIFYKPTTV